MLDSLLNALNTLNATDFMGTVDCIPQPYLKGGAAATDIPKYDLPPVLVPPEIIEVEGITPEAGSEGQIKKEEWPEYYFRIFPSDVRPLFPSSGSSSHLSISGVTGPKYASGLCYPQCAD